MLLPESGYAGVNLLSIILPPSSNVKVPRFGLKNTAVKEITDRDVIADV